MSDWDCSRLSTAEVEVTLTQETSEPRQELLKCRLRPQKLSLLRLLPPLLKVHVTRQLATSIKVRDLINSHWPFFLPASQTHTSGLIGYVTINLSGHLAAYFVTVGWLGPAGADGEVGVDCLHIHVSKSKSGLERVLMLTLQRAWTLEELQNEDVRGDTEVDKWRSQCSTAND